ncbi:MAG: hypothetical protein KA715_12010 [Xanthomonadaceae bacterium]|nr:hypothetical protein [Xanthomonadaceae bacterium]
MRTTQLFVILGAVVGLTALSSCRFGNNVVDSNTLSGAAPNDEFSKFEISYPNTPDQFQFCFFKSGIDSSGKPTAIPFCTAGDTTFTPHYVTQLLTNPLAISRFLDSNSKLYWGLFNPNEVPLSKAFRIDFDQTTGNFSYYTESDAYQLWPSVDAICGYQQIYFIDGQANPTLKTLGVTFQEYDVYDASCTTVLQKIADCLAGVAHSCTAEELKQWQTYFGPWLDHAGLKTNDIPLLVGSGFKVLFR